MRRAQFDRTKGEWHGQLCRHRSSRSRSCARPTPMLRARTRYSSGISSRPTLRSRVGRIASFRRARLPWCKRPFTTRSTQSTGVTSYMFSKDVSSASPDDDAAIIQWQCHGGENQQWRVEAVTGGYQLVARTSGKCLDVRGESTNDGGSITQWSCHGGANQTWLLRPISTVPPPLP